MTMCNSSCDGVQVIFSLMSLALDPRVHFGAFTRLHAEPLRTASIEIHNSAANTMSDIDQSLRR
jgi:hypothetical protein